MNVMTPMHATLVVQFPDDGPFLTKETPIPFVPSAGTVIVDDAADSVMSVVYVSWNIGSTTIEVHLDPPDEGSPEMLKEFGWKKE